MAFRCRLLPPRLEPRPGRTPHLARLDSRRLIGASAFASSLPPSLSPLRFRVCLVASSPPRKIQNSFAPPAPGVAFSSFPRLRPRLEKEKARVEKIVFYKDAVCTRMEKRRKMNPACAGRFSTSKPGVDDFSCALGLCATGHRKVVDASTTFNGVMNHHYGIPYLVFPISRREPDLKRQAFFMRTREQADPDEICK